MASRLFAQAKSAFLDPQIGWKTTHFWGPVANWGVALSGVYALVTKPADKLDINSTMALTAYSLIFTRFAWQVNPRNYLLFACHIFNLSVQAAKFYVINQYQSTLPEEMIKNKLRKDYLAYGALAMASGFVLGPAIQKAVNQCSLPKKLMNLVNHPAGPFTVFFWAPIGKWLLSFNNLADYKKDLETIEVEQTIALAVTGLIWTRYSFVINPVNYSLAAVNFALALSSGYHLFRKYAYDPFSVKME